MSRAHPIVFALQPRTHCSSRSRTRWTRLLSAFSDTFNSAAIRCRFAIFTARPSPFYLMDEVEPALDDLNLHRFLRLVGSFASASQVLIVTHQKRTMEIAGMLYGISLSTDGTTKVIAQRLDGSDVTPLEVAVDVPPGERVG